MIIILYIIIKNYIQFHKYTGDFSVLKYIPFCTFPVIGNTEDFTTSYFLGFRKFIINMEICSVRPVVGGCGTITQFSLSCVSLNSMEYIVES